MSDPEPAADPTQTAGETALAPPQPDAQPQPQPQPQPPHPQQPAPGPEPSAPDADRSPRQRETGPIELLWDLVFVFAVTQVTTLVKDHATWSGFGEAMLVLALVWWAWSAFVWACDAVDPDGPVLRAHLLISTVLIFVVGLAVPHAFGADGMLFAVAYALVRALHLSLYASAARGGQVSGPAIMSFAGTAAIGMVLLVLGAVWRGDARIALWVAAAVIDYAGPTVVGRNRMRGLQSIAVSHFAERYGDFVILALGESVVSIGVGVGEARRPLTPGLVIGASLGLVIAIGLWWTYFDRIAEQARQRLRDHADPMIAATESFSYLHLVIVAGVIILAAGIKMVDQGKVTAPMHDAGRLAFCGGVSIYLIGLAAFRLRLLRQPSPGRLGVAVAVMVVWAVGGHVASGVVTGLVAALVVALCAGERLLEQRHSPPTG